MRTQRQEYADLLEQLDKWGSFIVANMLWCLVAVPLVTLPAATAGLFTIMSLRVRGKQPELFREFFGAVRRLWLKSTIVVLLDVAAAGLLTLNFLIFPLMDSSDVLGMLSRSVSVFIGLGLLLVNLYLWPLMAVFDLPLRRLIDWSIKLALTYPLRSIGVLIVVLLPFAIGLLLPRFVWLLIVFSSAVFIANWGTWSVIRHHLSDEERRELEATYSWR